MKYKSLVSLALILTFILHTSNVNSSNSDSLNYSIANRILSEIKTEFAPDSRLAVFDVKLSNENQISLLPSTKLGDKIYGVINHSVINLRTEPGHAAEMSLQALLGMPVLILDETNGWYRVQTADNYIAWTEKSSVSASDKLQMNQWTSAQKIVF